MTTTTMMMMICSISTSITDALARVWDQQLKLYYTRREQHLSDSSSLRTILGYLNMRLIPKLNVDRLGITNHDGMKIL